MKGAFKVATLLFSMIY